MDCAHCRKPLHPARRADAVYCSDGCRKRGADTRRAVEILEAYDHQWVALRDGAFTGLARVRQEERLRELERQLFRLRYAIAPRLAAAIVTGYCGHSGCGAPLHRVGQQFCSGRCRVAAHRALKRSTARRRSP